MNRRHFILSGALAANAGSWPAAGARAAPGKAPVILVLGDSLSAEYGLKRGEGFIVITGDVGAGKTTLVKRLIATIDPNKIVAAHVVTTRCAACRWPAPRTTCCK